MWTAAGARRERELFGLVVVGSLRASCGREGEVCSARFAALSPSRLRTRGHTGCALCEVASPLVRDPVP